MLLSLSTFCATVLRPVWALVAVLLIVGGSATHATCAVRASTAPIASVAQGVSEERSVTVASDAVSAVAIAPDVQDQSPLAPPCGHCHEAEWGLANAPAAPAVTEVVPGSYTAARPMAIRSTFPDLGKPPPRI